MPDQNPTAILERVEAAMHRWKVDPECMVAAAVEWSADDLGSVLDELTPVEVERVRTLTRHLYGIAARVPGLDSDDPARKSNSIIDPWAELSNEEKG